MKTIWMIDDSLADLDTTSKALENLEQSIEFLEYTGFRNEEELIGRFPKSEYFDNVDYALIDLQLLRENLNADGGVLGGQKVLPLLRDRAPWLPLIAFSGYFNESVLKRTPSLGCYPFDGMVAKECILENEGMTRQIWRSMINRVLRSAFLRNTGFTYQDYDKQGHAIVIAESVKPIIESVDASFRVREDLRRGDGYINSFAEFLFQMFRFGGEITVDNLVPGLSGAAVLIVSVARKSSDGLGDSAWIVKLSKKPSKLWREVQCHLNVMRSGIDPGNVVPLLYNSVLKIGAYGVVIYQCAPAMTSMIDAIKKQPAKSVFNKVNETCKKLHKKPVINRIRVAKLIESSFVHADFPKFIIDGSEVTKVDEVFCAIFKKSLEHLRLAQELDLSWTFIHGDLHSRNVLVGNTATLIDFSRSGNGPLVIDLAKLCSDLFILNGEIFSKAPTWGNLMEEQKDAKYITELLPSPFVGDPLFFNLAMIVLLLQARGYYPELSKQNDITRVEDSINELINSVLMMLSARSDT